MQFDEMGLMTGKTLFLLPGTACDYQTNFGSVLDRPGEKYHLACVNYDGFDGSDLVFPDILTVTEKKKARTREKLKGFFEMDGETADKFMACFEKNAPESIKNEYYTDLLTWLEDDVHVEHTKAHFIYANKMGEKYLKRCRKYFRDPEIGEFNMQHEQWLFDGEEYALPALKAIDEFMEAQV